jgi:hypothetical protein
LLKLYRLKEILKKKKLQKKKLNFLYCNSIIKMAC